MHQALGLKYQKLAVSSIRLKDIITSSGGKVHGKAVLSGVESMGECVSVGTLDYWIRLKLPITQAIRLYQVTGIHVHVDTQNLLLLLILHCAYMHKNMDMYMPPLALMPRHLP